MMHDAFYLITGYIFFFILASKMAVMAPNGASSQAINANAPSLYYSIRPIQNVRNAVL